MPISAGQKAPDFTLVDEDEKSHSLSDYRGKPVVLYFYPKDDTSGCTKEACNFRDDYSVYEDAGVTILGVSPDDAKSHTKFKTKYELYENRICIADESVRCRGCIESRIVLSGYHVDLSRGDYPGMESNK